jgi:hypothetical protein
MYVARCDESLHTVEDFTATLRIALDLLRDHVIGP